MILVTVGTHQLGFKRLIDEIERICLDNPCLVRQIIVQHGNSLPVKASISQFDFVPSKELAELQRSADLVITHAGVGSVMEALLAQKKVIACPRYFELGEHVDDHQVEWCQEIASKQWVLSFGKDGNLSDLINKSVNFVPRYTPNRDLQIYIENTFMCDSLKDNYF